MYADVSVKDRRNVQEVAPVLASVWTLLPRQWSMSGLCCPGIGQVVDFVAVGLTGVRLLT